MISPTVVFLIFLLPLISFAVIALIIRPFFNHKSQYAGYLTIACIAGSLALSIWTLISVNDNHGSISTGPVDWLSIGGEPILQLGLMIDQLTAIMVVIVSFCSLMVQIYSQGYMHGDSGYCRYYAAMSLFTASMLGLVMAGNLLQLFVFWELVGLCSYLLIGFWFHKPSAAAAAKKAFIVTRIGDFGLLAAVLYIFAKTGTLDIAEIHHEAIVVGGLLTGGVATWAAIGIFAGAVGKSAQFPLHVWLPDAMEGPTPVSSLIHSSTMVTAGVFLVARFFPIFTASETALMVVAGIGGFTAIFAASMALVANDIKRVLAYCTVSQLGYMMLGLGSIGLVYFYGDHPELRTEHLVIGITAIGIFHLFNHAFAKCLLFQASGSINHATGTFDMREMGGLRKHMPWTYLVYLIGTISMAGIWPLACFWSKDHILIEAMELNGAMQVFFYMGMITAFMTAFYMFRTLFMTFHGEYRGGASGHGHGGHGSHGGLHESPKVMIVPMLALALLAIGSGWLNANGWFSRFFGEHYPTSIVDNVFTMFTEHNALPLISLIVALLGVGLAYMMYIRRKPQGETIGQVFAAPYTVFSRKYWMDELYEKLFVVRILVDGLFRIIQAIDTYLVDGLVNGIGWGTLADGRVMRKAQTGQLQAYGLVMLLGLVVIIVFVFLFAR
ncbi:NADH-quinone oxidoreductase subunit L [Chloroflexota bacterium]